MPDNQRTCDPTRSGRDPQPEPATWTPARSPATPMWSAGILRTPVIFPVATRWPWLDPDPKVTWPRSFDTPGVFSRLEPNHRSPAGRRRWATR